MKRYFLWVVLLAATLPVIIGCKKMTSGERRILDFVSSSREWPFSGGFTPSELRSFAALEPIDTHSHVRRVDPEFNAMLDRLNIHLLDILFIDDLDPENNKLQPERQGALRFIRSSNGRAVLCTTFDPFKINDPDFANSAIHDLDNDFANGAIAVKVWKNIGMEIKDAKGNYILPDDPALNPIYDDIAAHNKTLVAHLADPDSAWAPLDPASPDYSYYSAFPEWYENGKPNGPSKIKILAARDHVLDQHPNLRFVGAHLGSMESNLPLLASYFERYPNFAVDLAGRLPYLALQPRDKAIAFILKYQDRLIYATDLALRDSENVKARNRFWETSYAREWRFLATDDTVQFETVKAKGLALPDSVLRNIYHNNAVHWFPGIFPSP